MKVIGLNGSPRRDGNTFHCLQVVGEQLNREGIDFEILQVGGRDIRGCMACGGCREGGCVFGDDAFREWTEKMYAADGLLVGSPVYYAGVNGTLKSFLDRAFYQAHGAMRHKVGSSVLVPRRTGGMPAFEQINNYFLISEMLIAPSYYWNVVHGGAKGEVLQDTEGMSVLRNLGQNMAWMLKMKQATAQTLPPPQAAARDWMNFIR